MRLALLLLVGCVKDPKPAACGALTMTLDGKPLAMAHGLGYKDGDGWSIIVTAAKHACGEEHLDDRLEFTDVAETEAGGFGYRLANPLMEGYSIHAFGGKCFKDDRKTEIPCGEVRTKIDKVPKAAGDPMAMCVAVRKERLGQDDTHAIVVTGTIDATYCGEKK